MMTGKNACRINEELSRGGKVALSRAGWEAYDITAIMCGYSTKKEWIARGGNPVIAEYDPAKVKVTWDNVKIFDMERIPGKGPCPDCRADPGWYRGLGVREPCKTCQGSI